VFDSTPVKIICQSFLFFVFCFKKRLTKLIIRCINREYEQRRSFLEQELPALNTDAFAFLIYKDNKRIAGNFPCTGIHGR